MQQLTRDIVIAQLSKLRHRFTERELHDYLGVVTPEGKTDLLGILNTLVDEGVLCKDGGKAYLKMDFANFPKIVSLKDIKIEKTNWLWYPYIPYGKLTLLEGDPGIGKSWLTLAIVAAVSLGYGLPLQSDIANGPCLIASAEDGLNDTIKPRLLAMQANMELINATDEVFTLDELGFQWLENKIVENIPVLLVVDPLVAFISGAMDIHKANQVRYATSRLAKLADKYGIAILAVRHLTKGTDNKKAIYRGLGSIDFIAAARSTLLAGEDTETKQRGFVHIKCNLAPLGDPIGYKIEEDNFYWLDHCELTSDRILQTHTDNESTALDEAKEFITEVLGNGDCPSKEIYVEAEENKISTATLNRAKKELGIETYRFGEKGIKGGGVWYWKLPKNHKK